MATIGLLHPGQMGAALGRALAGNGHLVMWASESRSAESKRRAEEAGLAEVGGVDELASRSEFVFSVCPPDAAEDVGAQVASAGFGGVYVDANAASPATAHAVASAVARSGASFVDGSIIGPAPSTAGSTRLYLAGDRATEAAGLLKGSVFEAVVLDKEIGAPKALKACYAGWTKTTNALLLAIRAAARRYGVEESLLGEWRMSQPQLEARSERAARSAAPRAWRYVGEMKEHSRTFADAGVPFAFHEAAAEVFSRLAAFRDMPGCELDEVLQALGETPS